jgi:hypothetical protein
MANDMTNLIKRARMKNMSIRVEESWRGVYLTWENRREDSNYCFDDDLDFEGLESLDPARE